MRILRGVLTLFCWLCLSPAHAADHGPKPLAPSEYLTGSFALERHLDGFDRPLVSEGWFFVSAEHGLVWATTKPIQTTIVMDETGIRQVGGNATAAIPEAAKNLVKSLTDIILGNLTDRNDSFEVEMTANSPGTWQARLTPKTEAVAAQIQVIEAAGGAAVTKITVHKAGADFDVIRLSDHLLATGDLPAHVITVLE